MSYRTCFAYMPLHPILAVLYDMYIGMATTSTVFKSYFVFINWCLCDHLHIYVA